VHRIAGEGMKSNFKFSNSGFHGEIESNRPVTADLCVPLPGIAAGRASVVDAVPKGGQMDEAKASFEKAFALTSQEQQRRFFRRRLPK
jgi:hypothetical protein